MLKTILISITIYWLFSNMNPTFFSGWMAGIFTFALLSTINQKDDL